jgi:hypothetical protein
MPGPSPWMSQTGPRGTATQGQLTTTTLPADEAAQALKGGLGRNGRSGRTESGDHRRRCIPIIRRRRYRESCSRPTIRPDPCRSLGLPERRGVRVLTDPGRRRAARIGRESRDGMTR